VSRRSAVPADLRAPLQRAEGLPATGAGHSRPSAAEQTIISLLPTRSTRDKNSSDRRGERGSDGVEGSLFIDDRYLFHGKVVRASEEIADAVFGGRNDELFYFARKYSYRAISKPKHARN
jgi:hypothetical protein